MKCPNCRCEIGNLTTCPYCGAVLYRRSTAAQSRSRQESYSAPQAAARPRQSEVYQAPRAPRPAPAAQPTRSPARSRSEQRKERHLANLDTWGLLTVIFLAGIFVLELLQVILQVV